MSFYRNRDITHADIIRGFLVIPFNGLLYTLLLVSLVAIALLVSDYTKFSTNLRQKHNLFMKIWDILYFLYQLLISSVSFDYKYPLYAYVMMLVVTLKFFFMADLNSVISTQLVIEPRPLVFDSLEDILNPAMDKKTLILREGAVERHKMMRGNTAIFRKFQQKIIRQR